MTVVIGLKREDYQYCPICGTPGHLDEHHVVFRSQGGTDGQKIYICRTCHGRRHNEEILIEIENGQLKVADKETGVVTYHSLKPHVPAAEEGEVAYRLHGKIMDFKKEVEFRFWLLGEALKTMRDQELYKILGAETFNEYLGFPEIAIQRTQAYKLIKVVEHCERLEIEPERVQQLDKDKLAVALSKAQPETVDDILADCEVLSRSDIRETYGGGSGGGSRQESICEQEFVCQFCGKTNRVKV